MYLSWVCQQTVSLQTLRLELDLPPVAKNQTAEAVPFRLVFPLGTDRDLIDGSRFHRRQRRMQRKRHAASTFFAAADENGQHIPEAADDRECGKGERGAQGD